MQIRGFDEGLIVRFRRKVLAEAERKRRLMGFQRKLEYTSAALQEVTGMAPAALAAIAEDVKSEYASEDDRFFSVPAQIACVAIPVLLAVIAVWLAAIWL